MAAPEPNEFAIRTLAMSDTSIRVSVHGDLDLATAPQLEHALLREMAEHRAVVLDLAPTTFMDSSGITVLMRAINDAKVNGWNLSGAEEIGENVKRVLELTAVLPMLPLIEE